jgi:nucleoside-diphosphate-sugar epimerase
MNILLTGSSGRIGRAIHARLCGEHRIVGFDVAPAATTEVVSSLAKTQRLRAELRDIDTVIHTASLHAPHVGVRSEAEFEAVNVDGTRDLVRLAMQAGVRRLVYTSTTAVYAAAAIAPDRAAWIDEDTPPLPRTIYHRSKLAAEAIVEAAAQDHGMPVCVIRMSRCFPEPAPVMALYRLHRGVDARDVADAHAAAVCDVHAGFRRYVVSGATVFTPEDAHELFRDAPAVLKRRAPDLVEAFERRRWPLPASIDRVYSSGRIRADLAWRPRYGYAEVLAELDRGSSTMLAASMCNRGRRAE